MAGSRHRTHVVTLIDYIGLGGGAKEFGGAEAVAVSLTTRLDPERFRRTMVLYGRSEDPEDRREQEAMAGRLRAGGVEVIQLPRRSRYDLAAWRPLLRLLRTEGVHVLHAHKFGSNFWASVVARLAPVPIVFAHEHTWAFEGQPLRRFIDRWIIATGVDVYLAVSRMDQRRMISVEHIPAERVRVLPNGIPQPPSDLAVDLRSELGLPADAPVVGATGIFRAQKDFPTLVAAHARVRERVADAQLVILGDGPERPAIEQAIAAHGLEGTVHLPGLRVDAASLARGFDVAVNSSTFEGSSLAILEYMATARPIVATAVGGTPDLLGDTGRLVPASDAPALAEAVADLLCDPPTAAALGLRALERQRAEFDIDVQVSRLEALYGETLAAGSRRWRAAPRGSR